MARIAKIEPLVHKALIDKPVTRADDFLLVLEVYKEFLPKGAMFEKALEYHEVLGLPSFGSITRARRKLQAKYPELRNETAAAIRAEEEKEYRAYAVNN